jgi:membrane peptidoglycan carboxypeptidase
VGDLSGRVERHPPSGEARTVPLAAISPIVVDALIATEDERFRNNSGIDVLGLMRAIPYDVTHVSLAQGGSTLTEQLAKNLWLGGSDGAPWAKLKDMALALKLDRRYSKDEILAAYLNTAYFGQGAYGIGDASHRYFGVAPGSLDDVQATVLVGLVQAPSSYDPYVHPTAARIRQISVLRALVRVGRLRVDQAERLLAEPLPLANGRVVPGMRGVDLSTGSAFDWAGLALAVLAAAGAVAAGAVARRGRVVHPAVARVVFVLAVGLVAVSLIAAVRSMRVV